MDVVIIVLLTWIVVLPALVVASLVPRARATSRRHDAELQAETAAAGPADILN